MSEFLFQYYPVHPTTWVYLSSLLMIGLFFKFSRFWSVRNVDLALLILLAPGLLMVHFGEQRVWQTLSSEETVAVVDQGTAADVGGDADPVLRDDLDAAGELAIEETASQTIAVADDSEVQDGTEFPEDASSELPVGEGEPTTPDSESTQEATYLSGESIMLIGYIWLFSVLGIFLIRMFLDPTMVRRPLLEPNLSTGGLAFIGCSLFVFLTANVINSPVSDLDITGARSADQLLSGVADADLATNLQRHGPGNAILHSIPSFVTTPLYWQDVQQPSNAHYIRTAKAMAILSHLAVVVGIVAIGYQHFGSMKTGIGVATLYLMLPYTSMMTGNVDHVLPAAVGLGNPQLSSAIGSW